MNGNNSNTMKMFKERKGQFADLPAEAKQQVAIRVDKHAGSQRKWMIGSDEDYREIYRYDSSSEAEFYACAEAV